MRAGNDGSAPGTETVGVHTPQGWCAFVVATVWTLDFFAFADLGWNFPFDAPSFIYGALAVDKFCILAAGRFFVRSACIGDPAFYRRRLKHLREVHELLVHVILYSLIQPTVLFIYYGSYRFAIFFSYKIGNSFWNPISYAPGQIKKS